TFAHHLYPNVLLGFALPDERPVQWIVRRGAPDLLLAANRYLQLAKGSGRLAKLELEETGDVRPFEYEESREFQANLSERLPRSRALFEAASEQTGIDWSRLAAIGYQESKWNPVAESGDGALGMMMLTSETATAMGIADRSNAEQNISAGARYFASVREKV